MPEKTCSPKRVVTFALELRNSGRYFSSAIGAKLSCRDFCSSPSLAGPGLCGRPPLLDVVPRRSEDLDAMRFLVLLFG